MNLICEECKNKITTCDRCGDEFEEGDFVVCCCINGKIYHFCGEDCLYDFFSYENIFISCVYAKKEGDKK